MQIGQHFGKRKPRWNFFLEKHQSLTRHYGIALKYTCYGMLLQAIALSPVIYWSLQNYTFFENNIPLSYNLRVHLESERHWILSLFAICTLLTGAINFFIYARFATRQTLDLANAIEILPDEAVDQRHAS